jgi:ATP-binding cassette subfamily B protein
MNERIQYVGRVLRYLRPYRNLAVGSALLILLASATGLLAPWPLKIIIDSVLENQPLPEFIQTLLGPFLDDRFALLVIFVVAGLGVRLIGDGVTVLQNYVDSKIDLGMSLDFRGDLFQHAQRLSLAFHDQRETGKLMYAINYQGDAASRVVMTIPVLAQSLITLVGMVWVTFTIEPTLALLSLAVVPFLYYSVGYYMKHIEKRLMQVKQMEGRSLSIVHEAMAMLRVIVAFGRERYEYDRFRKQGEEAVDARVKLTVRQTMFSLAVNMTTAIGTALVLGFGAYKVMQGGLTVGQLLVVMAYIAAVYQPLESISSTIGSLQNQFISLRIAFDLLGNEPEIKDAPNAITIERAKGRVTFEGVDFGYKTRKITLKEISVEVQPGQVIAVVGPTGAGKTTLVSLIPRFYDPVRGRILLDGKDIRQVSLKSLRDQISIVLQEPLLFSSSIAENIRYGRLEATMDDIIEVAKAANAHEFIMKLPQQYETPVGERGVQLSGGERQRISVARAFLKNAPILILDEPTSSVDSKTEGVILDALDRLMVGRTTFMVAHRLSTIRHADKILVLDQGRLVEQGTHEELFEQGGLYRQLYDIQMKSDRRRTRQVVEGAPAENIEKRS